MQVPSVTDLAKMPVPDRLKLLEDLWDTLLADPDTLEMPDWHRAILDERLAGHRADPEAGTPWGEIRRRLRN
ncbi:addiction module protein [Lamprobacter modestohalophilus]|uniref:addiction module protein n=1 Tax=Lamprobacter modestohalophilus TaxID=1064514 RepID=UPI002ADEC1D1|nr:addiction module protein [Lamprobacter modestohalophilus]MEA1051567.1 addiction module protein [Lamprobacter modestohalophilus]